MNTTQNHHPMPDGVHCSCGEQFASAAMAQEHASRVNARLALSADLAQIRSTSQNDPDPADDAVNEAAKSWGAEPQPRPDGVAAGGLPCLQVAGVTVWLYRQDGIMRISVDTDDADETTPGYRPDGEFSIPMEFDVNGTTVKELS